LTFGETVLLGALAGFTIFLGLPIGRMRLLSARGRVCLAMFSVGVLAFIFVDVMEHAFSIVEGSVEAYKEDEGSLGRAVLLAASLGVAFAVGSAGLAPLERWMRRRPPLPPIRGAAVDTTLAFEEVEVADPRDEARKRALRTGLTIAVAIGLHNFAEGLAIGVAASSGAVALATVLIIGFALHNTTEGFGIVGPLGDVTPSWSWLGMVGLIGGAPTLLGAMLGYSVSSEPLELAFYAVSGGAILYVIGEIWTSMRRFGHRELGLWFLTLGFVVGVVTDLVVAYGGG
jgi:ZIP family zinc transporter